MLMTMMTTTTTLRVSIEAVVLKTYFSIYKAAQQTLKHDKLLVNTFFLDFLLTLNTFVNV